MEEGATLSRGQKDRFISQIVTPHNPTYLFGAVDKKGVTAQDTAGSRPIVGVACSVSGFKVQLSNDLSCLILVPYCRVPSTSIGSVITLRTEKLPAMGFWRERLDHASHCRSLHIMRTQT